MSCARWEERVALFAGGDLETSEADAVERHLSKCAACSALAADLRLELDGLREVHAEPLVAAHYAAVRERVLAELAKPPQRRVAWAWAAGLAVAAAAWVVWLVVRPNVLPAPETPRVVAVAPPEERVAQRESGSNRRPRSREKTGWQAKAPAPLVYESSVGTVGQTLSSVNHEVDPVLSRPVEDSPVRMVQLATDDPNVVIYWLFEEKGEER
ncbi:MAG: zf-HC2 domain-containing protein [Bryobacteraceae bacterium]